jgi:hypothetical protein
LCARASYICLSTSIIALKIFSSFFFLYVLIFYTQEKAEREEKNTTHDKTYCQHNTNALRIVQRKGREETRKATTTARRVFRISTLLYFFFSTLLTRRKEGEEEMSLFFLFIYTYLLRIFPFPFVIHSYLIIRKNEYRTTSSFFPRSTSTYTAHIPM